MSLTLITPPAAVPISIQEIRAQCRVDDASEDALLAAYLRSATDAIEQMTGLRLLDQTWEYTVDAFPDVCGWQRLPLAPLLQLISVIYTDPIGAVQTLPNTVYLIHGISDTQPARLILAPNQQWPATRRGHGSVIIRFRAGWIDHNAIPESLRQAVMMLASYWFSQREAAAIGPDSGPVSDVPFSVKQILEPYRVWAV
jgi:uncharacterized phiE125 gp8 family phage protein